MCEHTSEICFQMLSAVPVCYIENDSTQSFVFHYFHLYIERSRKFSSFPGAESFVQSLVKEVLFSSRCLHLDASAETCGVWFITVFRGLDLSLTYSSNNVRI